MEMPRLIVKARWSAPAAAGSSLLGDMAPSPDTGMGGAAASAWAIVLLGGIRARCWWLEQDPECWNVGSNTHKPKIYICKRRVATGGVHYTRSLSQISRFSLVGLTDLARSCSKGAVAVTGCLYPEEEEEEVTSSGGCVVAVRNLVFQNLASTVWLEVQSEHKLAVNTFVCGRGKVPLWQQVAWLAFVQQIFCLHLINIYQIKGWCSWHQAHLFWDLAFGSMISLPGFAWKRVPFHRQEGPSLLINSDRFNCKISRCPLCPSFSLQPLPAFVVCPKIQTSCTQCCPQLSGSNFRRAHQAIGALTGVYVLYGCYYFIYIKLFIDLNRYLYLNIYICIYLYLYISISIYPTS